MRSGYSLTVQGLIRKREALAGEAEVMRAQLGGLLSALDHIDAAIRVFRPDIDLADLPARPVPPPLSGTRGDLQRFLLEELRKANAPQSTFDLADKIMEKRGLDPADKIALSLIRKRTGYALAKLRKAGKVLSRAKGKGAPLEWCIADTTRG